MRRVGVIGCGKIGTPLIQALQKGDAGANQLVAVLTRNSRQLDELQAFTEIEDFLDAEPELVIDVSTAEYFSSIAVQTLAKADVWTVNVTALADLELVQELEACGRDNGHRLRILHGAIAGLDGVAALAVDDDAEIEMSVEVALSPGSPECLFKGSVRDAASRFPDGVNVALAAGFAGTGLDRTQLEVTQAAQANIRSLTLDGKSKYGQVEVKSVPVVRPDLGIHAVTASIIAALRREDQVIWVS